MKLLYLVIAHKNPGQMARMIRRLSGPEASFLVHVDGQVPLRQFAEEFEDAPVEGLRWSHRRFRSPWGTFGMSRAILFNLRDILAAADQPDYIICISGQDYPLQPPDRIQAFFAAAAGRPVMSCTPLQDLEGWGPDRFYRVSTYFYWHPLSKELRTYPTGEPARTFKARLLDMALRRLFPLPKPIPPSWVVHGGSSWWAIPPACARYIIEQDTKDPSFRKLFRTCSVPEELFFQSILGNSGEWRGRLDPRLLHYQHWSTSKHPDTLTVANRAALQAAAAEFPFARKFDVQVDDAILDWIDQNLLSCCQGRSRSS